MAKSEAERAKEYRDRQRGGAPRALKPCGTVAAYKRHQRKGEPIDDACAAAWAAEQKRMYDARKARKG